MKNNNCITCAGSVINGLCSYCGNFYGPVKPEFNLGEFKSPEAKALAYKLSKTELHNTAERVFVSKQLQAVKEADVKGTFNKYPGPSFHQQKARQLTRLGKIVVCMIIITALVGFKHLLLHS